MSALENIDRREALGRMARFAALSVPLIGQSTATGHDDSGGFGGGFGVCASLVDCAVLQRGGCAFLEEKVTDFLVPDRPEEDFLARLAILNKSPLPVPVCRVFLPGSLSCVGNVVKTEALSAYVSNAMKRAEAAGVKIIVFGSGGARRVPDGFSAEKAREQLTGFLQEMASAGARHGVTIALEPLNRGETNMVNSIRDAVEIVEALAHPRLQLLVDIYHMHKEGEPADEILRTGKHIRHCHIAEFDARTAPVTMKDDFRPSFRALKKVGYTGRLSIESSWGDMATQLPLALGILRRQIAEA